MADKVKESLWKLGGLSSKDLARCIWAEMNSDDVFGVAAQLAYYFLLALFPLLIFLTSAIGLLLGAGPGMRQTLFAYLARVMPPSAFQTIDATISEVSNASGRRKTLFWFAGSAVGGFQWNGSHYSGA